MTSRDLGRLALTALLAVAAASAAAGQGAAGQAASAGAVQQGDRQTKQFEQLQRQLHRPGDPTHPDINPGKSGAATAAATGPAFHLDHIVTDRSAILTPAEIAKVTDPYRNRNVTLADLQQAVAAINRLYRDQGVLTAEAVLPRQQVVNGVVHIALIEAKLDRIAIVGARDTHPQFFLRRLHARPGQLLRLDALRHDLILLNNGNGVQARALLRPGSQFGTTDLLIEVQEPDALSLSPSFDNVGRASVGLQRLGLNLGDSSLFGDRDALTLATSWATGTFSQSAAYSVPLGATGTRLSVGADYAGVRVLSGQLTSLGIRGNSLDINVGISQPLIATAGVLLTGTAALNAIQSNTTSSSVPISQQYVTAGEVGATLQWFDPAGVWIAGDSLDFGTLHSGATSGGNANAASGNNWFAKDTATLAREERLGSALAGLFRFTGQSRIAAPSAGLPLVEQMQVGGLSSVRGYPEGWQIADIGYTLTTELDAPLPLRQYFFGGWFSRGLQGALFFDHGGVFGLPGLHSGPHATPRDLYLTSSGLGVIFSAPYLSGRMDWAAPLENRAGLPKVGFDFYLQPRPPTSWWTFWRHGEK